MKHSWETSFKEICPRFCLTLHLQTSQMTELFDMGIAKRALVNSYRWCFPTYSCDILQSAITLKPLALYPLDPSHAAKITEQLRHSPQDPWKCPVVSGTKTLVAVFKLCKFVMWGLNESHFFFYCRGFGVILFFSYSYVICSVLVLDYINILCKCY